ncbi:glycosyltransferase involved in cell wall biosynthesis [Nocardia tenerifensis]|uniref:Glycosyltransferase involved in cell wall biosynthesis n=1 Tax=Nocardia tenerifensis TaxID=228006 RepID=A0A318JVA9_9NOCA|nr:glycosyltransferase family 4 protein [Nocardia tenerifensis]PXX61054.1 glycosyltransferase involved in cell wall biosynthesis [Nocardia tenerifensis]
MRILLINHTPLQGSGSGTYTANLRRALRTRGHRVAVLVPASDVGLAETDSADYTFTVPLAAFPSFTGHPASPLTYDALGPRDLSALADAWGRAIGRAVERFRPDVVHVQHLWIPFEATRGHGRPVVVTCHGSEIGMLRSHRLSHGRRYLSGAEQPPIICISRFVLERLRSEIAAEANNAILLRNSYDDTLFTPAAEFPTDTVRIGFVGRLVAYKRADFFLELARTLIAAGFPGEFLIVGGGPDLPGLREQARRLGLSGSVRFRGVVPHEQMPDIYRGLSALVTCAEAEPFGLAAIEAAACGTPAIVPRSGGLGELEHEPHVVGYDAGSLASAASAIRRVVRADGRPAAAARRRRAAYIRATFGSARYLHTLEDIYAAAARGAAGVSR